MSTEKQGCPFHGHGATATPAFSLIDVLGGFVRTGPRSETLDGSISLRALSCRPFVDGNETGLYVWLAQPAMISRDPDRSALHMTDELYAVANDGYGERIADL